MTNNAIPVSFNGSCAPITYPCTVNDRYIDPCSCTRYFLCQFRGSIIPQQCSGGTGFDYTNAGCRLLEDLVFQGRCDQKKTWKRCKAADSDAYDDDDINEYELERRCTGTTNGTTTTLSPGPKDDGVNGGLIAGIIIAVLLIVIIAVLLVVYIRKKGNPIKNLTRKQGGDESNRRPTSSRYGSGHGHDEETYAEIDDSALYKDPTTHGKSLGPSLSHSNETYDRDDVPEVVAYDNPALKSGMPPPRDLDVCPPLPEYSALEEGGHIARSYSSLNEYNATVNSNSNPPTTGDDGYLVAGAIDQSQHSENAVDPNYFVLEKEESTSKSPVISN